MTRNELIRKYWRYYRMLEGKFRETTNYVEIDTSNFPTYSNEYAMLLQSIGAELDNVFKVYCGFNPMDRKNITDYANYILTEYPAIVSDEIGVRGTDVKIIPYQGWTATAAAQSLVWWQAFDNVKHNRNGYFVEANQGNVLKTLAALYILEMKLFTKAKKATNPAELSDWDIPDEDSRVFLYPKWKFRCVDINDPVFDELEV